MPYNKSKVFHLLSEELALAKLQLKPSLKQPFKYFTQCLFMFLNIPSPYYNIIHIYQTSLPHDIPKSLVHIPVKCRCNCQTKWNNAELVLAISGNKCCFLSIFNSNWNVPVPRCYIQR